MTWAAQKLAGNCPLKFVGLISKVHKKNLKNIFNPKESLVGDIVRICAQCVLQSFAYFLKFYFSNVSRNKFDFLPGVGCGVGAGVGTGVGTGVGKGKPGTQIC